MELEQVFEDVACTRCGCVCDDLRVTVRDGRIVQVANACPVSAPWFLRQGERRPPLARISDQTVTYEAAIKRAAEILAAARAPLIYGLTGSSTPGHRAALALADRLGAAIDTTGGSHHGAATLAFQSAGESTATLGEIRQRSDLVIYWGSNPVKSHPRHLERYSLQPASDLLPRGRADRTLVVVDTQPTATSALADLFIPIKAGRDYEALATLRSLVQDRPVEPNAPMGASADQLTELARRMKSCRSGVVFYGPGLTSSPASSANVEALLRLVTELNACTRFYARYMSGQGDTGGGGQALTWQTGFALGVNFARGYPRYQPGETTADALLARAEVDAALIVGSETLAALSPRAIDQLNKIPTIALDSPMSESPFAADVRLTTAIYGVHLPGTAYRMDDVPIPLRAILTSEYPSDERVLRDLRAVLAPGDA